MNRLPGETEETFFPGEARPKTEDDEAAERFAKERAELRTAGLAKCMEQEWFREWIMEHLISLNTFGMTFGVSPAGFPDPHATFYHAGLKAAGEALFEKLDAITPELSALMRRETFAPKT